MRAQSAEKEGSISDFPHDDRVHADALPHPIGKDSPRHGSYIDLEHDDAENPDEADHDADDTDEAAGTAKGAAPAQQQGDADTDRGQVPTEEGEECAEEMDPAEAELVVVLTAVDHGNEHHSQGMEEGKDNDRQSQWQP